MTSLRMRKCSAKKIKFRKILTPVSKRMPTEHVKKIASSTQKQKSIIGVRNSLGSLRKKGSECNRKPLNSSMEEVLSKGMRKSLLRSCTKQVLYVDSQNSKSISNNLSPVNFVVNPKEKVYTKRTKKSSTAFQKQKSSNEKGKKKPLNSSEKEVLSKGMRKSLRSYTKQVFYGDSQISKSMSNNLSPVNFVVNAKGKVSTKRTRKLSRVFQNQKSSEEEPVSNPGKLIPLRKTRNSLTPYQQQISNDNNEKSLVISKEIFSSNKFSTSSIEQLTPKYMTRRYLAISKKQMSNKNSQKLITPARQKSSKSNKLSVRTGKLLPPRHTRKSLATVQQQMSNESCEKITTPIKQNFSSSTEKQLPPQHTRKSSATTHQQIPDDEKIITPVKQTSKSDSTEKQLSSQHTKNSSSFSPPQQKPDKNYNVTLVKGNFFKPSVSTEKRLSPRLTRKSLAATHQQISNEILHNYVVLRKQKSLGDTKKRGSFQKTRDTAQRASLPVSQHQTSEITPDSDEPLSNPEKQALSVSQQELSNENIQNSIVSVKQKLAAISPLHYTHSQQQVSNENTQKAPNQKSLNSLSSTGKQIFRRQSRKSTIQQPTVDEISSNSFITRMKQRRSRFVNISNYPDRKRQAQNIRISQEQIPNEDSSVPIDVLSIKKPSQQRASDVQNLTNQKSLNSLACTKRKILHRQSRKSTIQQPTVDEISSNSFITPMKQRRSRFASISNYPDRKRQAQNIRKSQEQIPNEDSPVPIDELSIRTPVVEKNNLIRKSSVTFQEEVCCKNKKTACADIKYSDEYKKYLKDVPVDNLLSERKTLRKRKAKSDSKLPGKHTLKRKRFTIAAVRMADESYEDDIFEEYKEFEKFKDLIMTNTPGSVISCSMATPQLGFSVTPLIRKKTPKFKDCFSPTEYALHRKIAEECFYRNKKKKSASKTKTPEKVPEKRKLEFEEALSEAYKVRDAIEKLRKDESEEDSYFSDD